MNFEKIVLVAIIFFSITINAQSSLGIRYEPFIFYGEDDSTIPSEYKSNPFSYYFTSFYLDYNVMLSKEISFTFRPGILITDLHYGGVELFIISKYFWNNNCYILGGLNFHGNIPNGTIKKGVLIPLFVIGAGIELNKLINIEIHYERPFIKEFTWKSLAGADPKIVSGILKLSFGIGWKL